MSKKFYNETLGREMNFLSEQENALSTSENVYPIGYYITKDNSNTMKGVWVDRQSNIDRNSVNLQGREGEGFHYYFNGEESNDGDILVSSNDYAAAAPITFTATNAIDETAVGGKGNGLIQVKNSILIMDEPVPTPAAQSVNFMIMKYKAV